MESLRTHQHYSECTFIAECLAGKLDISASVLLCVIVRRLLGHVDGLGMGL